MMDAVILPAPKNVERVMERMQLMGSTPLHDAARDSGMAYSTFVLIRRLLMLKTWSEVSEDERLIIAKALQLADMEGKVGEAFRLSFPVVKKHWRQNTRDGRLLASPQRSNAASLRWQRSPKGREARRKHYEKRKAEKKNSARLDGTLFAIREACTNNDELQIPKLDEAVRRECVDVLDDAIHALMELRRKIRETTDEGSKEL